MMSDSEAVLHDDFGMRVFDRDTFESEEEEVIDEYGWRGEHCFSGGEDEVVYETSRDAAQKEGKEGDDVYDELT